MSDKDELAALKKKVEEQGRELAEIKAAQPKPPPEPFKPQPYEPIDWTARMSMPRSALEAMIAAEPRGFMRDVALRDARAPQSPSTIPSTQQRADVRPVAGDGSGWVAPTPLGPPPGVAQADRLMDAQDRRDRIELAHRIAAHEAAMRAAQKGKG